MLLLITLGAAAFDATDLPIIYDNLKYNFPVRFETGAKNFKILPCMQLDSQFISHIILLVKTFWQTLFIPTIHHVSLLY